MYIAIIGDIKESKSIQGRNYVQEDLKHTLSIINEKYRKEIVSKFSITLGDEFQGVLDEKCENVLDILLDIRLSMLPIKFRIGIGLGDASVEIDYNSPIGSDGNVYYNAREALREIKNFENKNESITTDTRVCIKYGLMGSSNTLDLKTVEVVNALLSSCMFIYERWSDKQIAVINLLKLDYSQEKMAKVLNIKQSSVQKRIKASGYYTYRYCINQINSCLSCFRRVI